MSVVWRRSILRFNWHNGWYVKAVASILVHRRYIMLVPATDISKRMQAQVHAGPNVRQVEYLQI
jgi:hypothetical protein